ncbi:HU family DNA-binding protein [Riemerella columbina]|uniref:HU family DNA-binding protein n=1 Tax=Riemerella columbina TaxID=103810 RepID=UPI00036FCE7E|nr:HU family DNA-binding protein [Riemerella columbina]
MSIKYNVIEKGQPGVAGGGEKKWYAQVANNGELTIDDLVKQIEKFSALSEADIKGVLIALENVAQEALSEGKKVRLEKLGTLYPTLSSSGAATEKDFNQSLIRSVGVNYRAGKRILDAMKAAGFERIKKANP